MSAKIMKEMAGCSAAFLSSTAKGFKVIEADYNAIAKKSLRMKEKEKDLIVEYLTNMSDEAREIENNFKKHSLGRWSVGMQKGFKSYDAETYDQERQAIDAQAQREYEEEREDAVTEMRSDLYPDIITAEIEEGLDGYGGEDDNIDDDNYGEEM